MVIFEEPDIPLEGKSEAALQKAYVKVIAGILEGERLPFVALDSFGVDIGVFFEKSGTGVARFFELKAYSRQRQGGVPFAAKGAGPQLHLLWDDILEAHRPGDALRLFDEHIRWVLADVTRPIGTARYAFFRCSEAQAAAMGGVRPGKHNNLKVSALEPSYMTWTDLIRSTRTFLLDDKAR